MFRIKRVRENAATPVRLTESRTLAESTNSAPSESGRLLVQIINPGWGSSGFYPASVLESAAGSRVFPSGTQMYMDHPSYSEAVDRPERSVRDLAAVLTEDARWDSSLQALVAEVQVFGPYRDVLAEMAEAVGVSIRASAVVEEGEAEGRKGTIVSELVEGVSVDFVTQAGRGGRILSVLESHRPKARPRAGVDEATFNSTQQALRQALADAHGGSWIYIRDFDLETVWYEAETEDVETVYQSGYTSDGDTVALNGEPVEVEVQISYVPVKQAATQTTESTTEDHMPQIEEARLRQLEEDSGRVVTLEAERVAAVQRAETAEQSLAAAQVRESATPLASRILAESETLPPSTRARLLAETVNAAAVTEAGALDEAAFRIAVETARQTAETELAEALQSAGVGSVRGMGGTSSSDLTEADMNQAVAAAFGRKTTKEV